MLQRKYFYICSATCMVIHTVMSNKHFIAYFERLN